MASASEISVVITAVDSASNILGNIAGVIGNIASAAIDAAKAVAGLAFDGLQFAVGEAIESENAISNLEATLRSTKEAAGLTSQELQDMASELQSVTRFSDETILNGEAMLLTFTSIGKDIFPQATEAMLNLAQKMGSDATSAAIQLGKALNEPVEGVSALRRVGVMLTDEQEKQIKAFMEVNDKASAQKIILDELGVEFGNLARAMGENTEGKWIIFKNQISDIGEVVGNGLLPEMGEIVSKLIEWLPLMQAWGQQIADFFNGEWFSINVTDRILDFIDDIGGALQSGDWSAVVEDLKNLWDEMILPLWDKIQEWTAIAKDKFNTFMIGVFEGIEEKIDEWVAGDGPQKLTEKITAWIDKSGLPEMMKSKMQIAAEGMLDSLVEAVGDIDWGAIAGAIDDRLAEGIRSIDWKESGKAFVDSIVNIFSGDGSLGVTLTRIAQLLNFPYLIKTIFDALKIVFNDTGDAIGDAAGDFVSGIINKIKELFGISSPSTVFAEIARELVLGFIQGWQSSFGMFLNILQGSIALIKGTLGGALDLGGMSAGVQGDASSLLGGSSGTVGGRSTGGTTLSGSTKAVNNYYYGPVYFGAAGEPGAYYDCPSPSPFIAASKGTVGGGSKIR